MLLTTTIEIRKKIIDVHTLSENSHATVLAKCDNCGVEIYNSYRNYLKNIKKYNIFTCVHCSSVKSKKTKLLKYGDENYNNRIKSVETCLEKYGVDNVFQLEDTKEKSKETCKQKYGVEYIQQTETFKENLRQKNVHLITDDNHEKIKEIIKKRYGVEYALENKEIRTLCCITQRKNNIKKIMIKNKNIINVDYDNNIYKINCNKKHTFEISPSLYSQRYFAKTEICTICNSINKHTSGKEIELLNFIEQNYKGTIIVNSRSIVSPYELDIYLPNLNLAFEFNGLYWHSEIHKEKTYHFKKSNLCEIFNINLIQIWEDDWNNKNDIVKSIILNLLNVQEKIIFENFEIREISNKLSKKFLIYNHINGYEKSNIRFGVFQDEILISIMTFKRHKNGIYELSRFCDKLYNNFVNHKTILIHIIEKIKPIKIICFSNCSYINKDFFLTLGFYVKKVSIDYNYIINKIRQKKFIKHSIMIENGYYRIYDKKITFHYDV